MVAGKSGDLEAELVHQRFVRDSLKEEIFRLENQSKPTQLAVDPSDVFGLKRLKET